MLLIFLGKVLHSDKFLFTSHATHAQAKICTTKRTRDASWPYSVIQLIEWLASSTTSKVRFFSRLNIIGLLLLFIPHPSLDLQVAHWKSGYRPDWADLSLMEWIQKAELKDDNLIVRKLVDESFNAPIDETDLMHATAILRCRVVVGLMNEMEESVHRFNIVLGIDETLESNRQCMNSYFGKKEDSGMKNSNKHPKASSLLSLH